MKIVGDEYQMIFSFPKDFKKLAHDFIAFTMKYGRKFLKFYTEFTGYAIVPENEAEELVKSSKIEIAEELKVHKFVLFS